MPDYVLAEGSDVWSLVSIQQRQQEATSLGENKLYMQS